MTEFSADLPEHVGRVVDVETGYALVCNYVEGDPHTGQLCGKPAVRHLRWREQDTENGFACEAHIESARYFDPFDEHGVEDSACGIPGAFWVNGDPSRCVMEVLDDEPELAGARELVVTA